jgi:hypothetical protein
MGRKRQERLEKALALLEAEYRAKLIVALHRCAQGQWGLFNQNGHLDIPDRMKRDTYAASGAEELDELGAEINQARDDLGMNAPYPLHVRLIASRGRKTENDLGEPKLASLWLRELGE